MNFSENYFDCAIITVLREEMKLFLDKFKENILIKEKKQNYTTFYFCDKKNNVRNGIIYNVGSDMGNTEACRLMYEFTRKYKADIYINVGLACGVNDVEIGDVIMVSDCFSLSENNSTTSQLQKTPLENYDKDYAESVFNNISEEFIVSFKNYSKTEIENTELIIDKKIKSKKEREIAMDFFRNKINNIHFGKCATVPSVVKDKKTFDQIKGIRKCNILEMEAYYLALWHGIIKNNENNKIDETSKFLILKSPSDNGISNTKTLLEKVGSRQLAMTNLSLVTKYLIEEIIDFHNSETKTIPNLIEEFYSNKSMDSTALNYEDRNSFNHLCSYIISNKSIDDYFEYAKNILKKDGAILTIYGPAGTGKSTFFTYLYNELKKENCCIYIDISKIIKYDDSKSIDVCLYLIKRMIQTDNKKNIIILFDGFGKNIEAPSEFIINTFNKISQIVSLIDNQKISFCVNEMYDGKKESAYLPEFFSRFSISFTNVSINDESFEDLIKSFYEYYHNVVFLPDDFSAKVISKLKNSEIQCVDFRLLKAIADNYITFKNSNNFHDFIKAYSIQISVTAHALMDISNYMYNNYYTEAETRSFEMSQIPEKYIAPYKKLSQNIYTNAFLLSMKIWNSCTSSTSEFDSYEFLISKNINSFLAYYIKSSNNRDANTKFQIVLTKIARNTISKSAAMQLMYIMSQRSVFRMLNQQNKRMLKTLVEDKAKNVFEKNDNISYIEIMEQRTMSIIMCICFNEDKYLREYNELMIRNVNLDEINDYLNYNIAFHILYFSRETFTFSDIENATVEQIKSNIIYYAYDSIAAFLKTNLNNINQLHIMNFITLLFIYKKHICINEELMKYKNDCGKLLKEIFNIYNNQSILSDDLSSFYNECID